jgi:PncC family amidohydrolase
MKFYLDDTEDIFLYQLLKAASVFEEYAHIRRVTLDGQIKVNGQTVFKQRTRIFPGDEITYKDIHIKIIAGKSPPEKRESAEYRKPEKVEVREERVHHGKTQSWHKKPLVKEKNLLSELELSVQKLANRFSRTELTLALAESCTGGMASKYITSQSGASGYFLGSVVSYANPVKTKLLKVSESLLEKDGAVSEAAAQAMAKGVQKLLGSEISGAITGIAGPEGGIPGKPVGTVFIAVRYRDHNNAQRFQFRGNREEIRQKSCLELFRMLQQLLSEPEEG